MRLTDFYVASPVCTPSRGALMTGCYPSRFGFDSFSGVHVLFPGMRFGLNPAEITIARMLKDAGYATQMVGKWHCGDQRDFLPTNHGFDSWFGLPYSNDMGRQRNDMPKEMREGMESFLGIKLQDGDYPPLPLMLDDTVQEEQPDQAALTERYLHRLQDSLRASGFAHDLYLMLSSGGITTVDTAAKFPVRLTESGPAAGARSG